MARLWSTLRIILLMIGGLAAFLAAYMVLGMVGTLAFAAFVYFGLSGIIVGIFLFIGLVTASYLLIGRFVIRRF